MVPKKPSSLVLDWTGDLIDQDVFFRRFFLGGIGHQSKAPGSSVFYEDFVSVFSFLKDGINSHQTDTFWMLLVSKAPLRKPGSTNKDSLYLMTTALKGSALILTWACTLAFPNLLLTWGMVGMVWLQLCMSIIVGCH